VLGETPPGPGLHIATTGAISTEQRPVPFTVDRYDDIPGEPGRALRRGPLRSTMDLDDADLRAWDGYSLEVFAMDVPDDLPGSEGRLVWTMNWRDEGMAPSHTLPVRQWARYGASPVYAELLWLPGDKPRAAIQGDVERASGPDLTKAKAGVGLLRHTGLLHSLGRNLKRGRPPKGARWTAEQIIEWYEEAREDYISHGDVVTLRDFADAIGVRSLETARTRLRKERLTWPPA